MRIVLPPSETKQPGGVDKTLAWDSLVLPQVGDVRRGIATDLVALCGDEVAASKALGLGTKGAEWIQANRELESAPVMPALTRYTGVLFDALDYGSLDKDAQSRADQTVWLFSALFGPLRATDLIPRYRLSFDSKLPGESLKSRWQGHAEEIWAGDFTVDLRSEGYRSLAPLPAGAGVYVRVVKDLAGGAAAGHANKATKGRLVQDLLTGDVQVSSRDELLDALARLGWSVAAVDGEEHEIALAAG
jgi:cytoplasmic iron level regulating protein YaaA (DUF328/UPF0246 family)